MKGARDQKEVQATMNKYELALVVNAKIEEDVRLATVDKAKDYVAKFGGNVTEVEEWGKKRLAYEIQKMHEGYYYFVHFEAEPECPVELESHMHIMDNVLRYLIVNQTDEAAVEQPKADNAAAEESAEEKTPLE